MQAFQPSQLKNRSSAFFFRIEMNHAALIFVGLCGTAVGPDVFYMP
jgi:hypothetical protein